MTYSYREQAGYYDGYAFKLLSDDRTVEKFYGMDVEVSWYSDVEPEQDFLLFGRDAHVVKDTDLFITSPNGCVETRTQHHERVVNETAAFEGDRFDFDFTRDQITTTNYDDGRIKTVETSWVVDVDACGATIVGDEIVFNEVTINLYREGSKGVYEDEIVLCSANMDDIEDALHFRAADEAWDRTADKAEDAFFAAHATSSTDMLIAA